MVPFADCANHSFEHNANFSLGEAFSRWGRQTGPLGCLRVWGQRGAGTGTALSLHRPCRAAPGPLPCMHVGDVSAFRTLQAQAQVACSGLGAHHSHLTP